MLNLLLYYINQNKLSKFENINKYIKSCVLFTSHEYVVRVTLFQYVSLTELNAWEDEWFIGIGALQEGRKKQRNWKKGKKI